MNKPYTLASERAAASVGCPYIAPLMASNWFRCDVTPASGCRRLGRDVAPLKSTPVQIFVDGEWHTVVGWDTDACQPAEVSSHSPQEVSHEAQN